MHCNNIEYQKTVICFHGLVQCACAQLSHITKLNLWKCNFLCLSNNLLWHSWYRVEITNIWKAPQNHRNHRKKCIRQFIDKFRWAKPKSICTSWPNNSERNKAREVDGGIGEFRVPLVCGLQGLQDWRFGGHVEFCGHWLRKFIGKLDWNLNITFLDWIYESNCLLNFWPESGSNSHIRNF